MMLVEELSMFKRKAEFQDQMKLVLDELKALGTQMDNLKLSVPRCTTSLKL